MWARISRFYPPWLELIPVLLLGFVFFYTTTHYAQLPQQMPTHFGPSGQADDWSSKSFASVYLPLLIGTFTWLSVVIVNYFFIIQSEDPGKYINLPKKQKEKLGPAELEAIRTVTAKGMILINITVVLMIAMIQYGAVNTALGLQKGLGWGINVVVGALMVECIWLCIKTFSMSYATKKS